MGAWSTAIFDDDTPRDIRDDYLELLRDKVPDQEATRLTIEKNTHLAEEQGHLLWLALAAAQTSVGRLDPQVKAHALTVIDHGEGLDLWKQAGPTELAQRQAVLAELRQQLTGPQPARKTLRRPAAARIRVRVGDVFTIPCPESTLAIGQVVGAYLKHSYYFAIFDQVLSPSQLPDGVATILRHRPALLALSFDAKLHSAQWQMVGNHPIHHHIAFPTYKVLTPQGLMVEDHTGERLRPATRTDERLVPYRTLSSAQVVEDAVHAKLGYRAWIAAYDKFLLD